MKLNKKELLRLIDLTQRVTSESDFEYQDDEYREELMDLELKLFKLLDKWEGN